jgi:hypothetical protein
VKGEDESEGFAHHGRKREQEAPSRAFTQKDSEGMRRLIYLSFFPELQYDQCV